VSEAPGRRSAKPSQPALRCRWSVQHEEGGRGVLAPFADPGRLDALAVHEFVDPLVRDGPIFTVLSCGWHRFDAIKLRTNAGTGR